MPSPRRRSGERDRAVIERRADDQHGDQDQVEGDRSSMTPRAGRRAWRSSRTPPGRPPDQACATHLRRRRPIAICATAAARIGNVRGETSPPRSRVCGETNASATIAAVSASIATGTRRSAA